MVTQHPTFNSRLVHSCVGLGQQRSLQSLRKVAWRCKRPPRKEDAASHTITEHWNLVARLHAKCGIYVELHAWSFAVRGILKVSCYLLSTRECFHIIESMAIDAHTILHFFRGSSVEVEDYPCVLHVHHQMDRKMFTSSRGRRGGMLQQSGLKPYG